MRGPNYRPTQTRLYSDLLGQPMARAAPSTGPVLAHTVTVTTMWQTTLCQHRTGTSLFSQAPQPDAQMWAVRNNHGPIRAASQPLTTTVIAAGPQQRGPNNGPKAVTAGTYPANTQQPWPHWAMRTHTSATKSPGAQPYGHEHYSRTTTIGNLCRTAKADIWPRHNSPLGPTRAGGSPWPHRAMPTYPQGAQRVNPILFWFCTPALAPQKKQIWQHMPDSRGQLMAKAQKFIRPNTGQTSTWPHRAMPTYPEAAFLMGGPLMSPIF